MYIEYEVLSRRFSGWTLTEMKRMPRRERAHWLAVIRWHHDRELLQ